MSEPREAPAEPLWPLAVMAGVLGWLVLAHLRAELDAWTAGKLFLLAAVTLWFLGRLGQSLGRGEWPTLESNWGGLGGGLGGWRASPSFVYLVGSLWFAGLLAYTAQGQDAAAPPVLDPGPAPVSAAP